MVYSFSSHFLIFYSNPLFDSCLFTLIFLDFLVAGETLLGLISVCDLLAIIKYL